MDFKEIIQKVKSSYDIVEYIQRNGVVLEPSGNGTWKGLCPFHNEKTPSFMVREDFQSFKCFGCGEGGDILSFAEHIHTVKLFEALKMLATEKGIEIENTNHEEINDINGIREVVSSARDFFRENYEKLDNSHPAKREVLKRGLDVNNSLYGFSLEAPRELYKYLKSKGHSDENIENSKLVIFKEGREPWDFFHGRLMITLSDYLGRPISFTSRKIYDDDRMKGKYVNGKESPVYLKKSMLFGADTAKREARAKRKIYVLEGQFDEISMKENGIMNAVATSGTAFTNEHANLLLRMVGDNGEIVFVMDGDEAGSNAVVKIFSEFPILHSKSYAVRLEDGRDPCDYIEKNEIDKLKEKMDNAVPIHDFILNHVLSENDGLINMNNSQKFVAEIAKYAKMTNDSYIVESMLNKASVMSAVAISNVRDIYNGIDVKGKPMQRAAAPNVRQYAPSMSLNSQSEADKCMFTAIALLIRMPMELSEHTPPLNELHKKFRPFLKEVFSNIEKYEDKWRFISEDYTDSDFAKMLQNKNFLGDPTSEKDATIAQYKYLIDQANQLYRREYEQTRRARALSSIVNSTDPKEIANVLNLYKESQ